MTLLANLLRLPLLTVLLLISFHPMVVAHILPARVGVHSLGLSMWKEYLLLTTLCCGAVTALARKRLPSLTSLDCSVLLFLSYCALSLPFSPSLLAGLYGARNYGEGFVALGLAARFLRLDEQDIWTLVRLLVAEAVVIAVWAVFQSTYLGPQFLLANGYGEDGQLHFSLFASGFPFQRAIGTFGSPNVFGLYLVIMLLVGIGVGRTRRVHVLVWSGALAVLSAALLASFSRSAAIGLAAGALMGRLLSPPLRQRHRKQALPMLSALAVAAALVVSVSGYLGALPQHLYRTVTLRDTSVVGHIQSVADAVHLLLEHPFGVGIGQNGPRSAVYTGQLANAESSYLIVAADIGIIGSLAYWAVWVATLTALRRGHRAALAAGSWTSAEFCRSAFAAVCAAATAGIFLPLNVEVEVMLVLFLLAGAALASAPAARAEPALASPPGRVDERALA